MRCTVPTGIGFRIIRFAAAANLCLLALIERVRTRASKALDAGGGEHVTEAGYDGFWLHRRPAAAGITNDVFDLPIIAAVICNSHRSQSPLMLTAARYAQVKSRPAHRTLDSNLQYERGAGYC